MGMGMGMGMAAPMGPPPGMPPGMPPMMAPPDPTEMMLQQIMALFEKWGSGEMQIAGEKSALGETLMMLLGAAPPQPQLAMAEPGAGAGMVGPPMEDIPVEAAPPGF